MKRPRREDQKQQDEKANGHPTADPDPQPATGQEASSNPPVSSAGMLSGVGVLRALRTPSTRGRNGTHARSPCRPACHDCSLFFANLVTHCLPVNGLRPDLQHCRLDVGRPVRIRSDQSARPNSRAKSRIHGMRSAVSGWVDIHDGTSVVSPALTCSRNRANAAGS